MQDLSTSNEENVIYKDVVIIGNGPSAISLSYMLNGNWPYYTGKPHPTDEMLTARLNYLSNSHNDQINNSEERLNIKDCESINDMTIKNNNSQNKSINIKSLFKYSPDELEILVTGLEGRSTNRPLPLLLDQLEHPGVDAGFNLPSLLSWKSIDNYLEHKIIDHVVLGKGPPGGAWQFMDPNVLTISLNRWMSLPGLNLQQWEKLINIKQIQTCKILYDRNNVESYEPMKRIPVGVVAAYYKDYVTRQGLAKYFKSGRTVTLVRPILESIDIDDPYRWIVEGYENLSGRKFYYKCKSVVLATGTTNLFNRLGLPNEELQSTWITYDLNDLESRLDRLAGRCEKCAANQNTSLNKVDPVLVIGAGLSAADAIVTARSRGIPVIHVFRDYSEMSEDNETGVKLSARIYDRLQSLPVSMYPEYHQVYGMMVDGCSYRLYKALPNYILVDLGIRSNDSNKKKERIVTLKSPNGQIFTFKVSVVAILIGSKPDLSYLGEYENKVGKIPNKPIDGKSNPIEVDEMTSQVIKSPKKGLYAVGPLVGDNFVRFLLGGTFGVVAHVLRTHESE